MKGGLFSSKIVIAFLLFITALALNSCEKEPPESAEDNSSPSLITTSQEIMTLSAKDTLYIPIDNRTSYAAFIQVWQSEEETYWYTTRHEMNKHLFDFYSPEKERKLFTFSLEDEGPQGIPTVSGSFVVNMDSIFILSSQTKRLSLVDSSGILKETWSLNKCVPDIPIFNLMGDFLYPLIVQNNRAYMQIIPEYPPEDPLFFEQPLELIVQLDSPALTPKASFDAFPPIFRQGLYYGVPSANPSRAIDRQGIIVYSFSLDHHLYIYEEDGRPGRRAEIRSKYLPTSAHTLTRSLSDEAGDEVGRYFRSNGRYFQILFDPWRDIYYRVVIHPGNWIDGQGKKILMEDLDFSIQIINKDFELLGEYVLPAKMYDFRRILVDKDGIYLSYTHEMNPTLKEDRFAYVRFSVLKVE